MKKTISYSLLAACLAFTFNSCKKAEVDTETQSATDNSVCEAEFSQVVPTVNGFAIGEQGVKKMSSGCYTITITGDTTNWSAIDPPVMTIDYGTAGCIGNDGKKRTGMVVATFNKRWHSDTLGNNALVIVLNNYKVNGIQYEGTIRVNKPAKNELNTQVINGKCTGANNSWNLEWACNRTMKLIAGAGDTDETNDVYEVTGVANGVNRKDVAYTLEVTKPLIKRYNCGFIESGTFDLTPDGLATRTVDYGDGSCDNKATLTINGNSFEFALK